MPQGEKVASNKKVYSFKSVGQLSQQYADDQVQTIKRTPVGIKTPVSFNNTSGDMFDMTFSVAAQVKDNLKNLLLTNAGERLMLTDFGANLRPLATELTKDDVVSEAIRRISVSAAKYMPYVELNTFESSVIPSQDGSTVGVSVRVGYSVPTIGATDQFIETIIYVIG
jgi:phage baseplate assembly protein W